MISAKKANLELTQNAINYAWKQLADRAGVSNHDNGTFGFDILGIPVYYTQPELVSCLSIIVVPSQKGSWRDILEKTPSSLDWISIRQIVPQDSQLPFNELIPVLCWGAGHEDGNKPFVERREDGSIIFYADILATTLFMLSRWEETIVLSRDQHDRFPSTSSLAYKQNFLDRPIVDEYALILQSWLKVLRPTWCPQPKKFSIKLSHDIDCIRRFPNLYWVGYALAENLLKTRSARHAAQILYERSRPTEDAYFQGIYQLADMSEKLDMVSAFYFMSADRGKYDNGYDLASPTLLRCIDNLRNRGHEIGIHPSYRTVDELQRFLSEKTRLDTILDMEWYGGRQHFLRFRVPDTWWQWEEANMAYDSTLGYADHEGFRCGTCHPFRPFCVEQDREINLVELPLLVMDVTLRQQRKLTPKQGEARILELAKRCQQVGGVFTLLWHNTSLIGEWLPWVEMYKRVTRMLIDM